MGIIYYICNKFIEMTTKIIQGSIVNSTADVIVHQVNCQFVMGSGVAKALRDKYPIIYDYYSTIKNTIIPVSSYYLGTAQFVPVNKEQTKHVINLFGQDFYGYDGKQYTNYDAIECALYTVKKHILFNPLYKHIKSISFPWNMGAARGGGNWEIIKNIIEHVFENTNIEIQYYQWNRNN